MIVNLKEQHCENFLQSLHKEQWQEVRLGEVAEIKTDIWKVGESEELYIGLEHIAANDLKLCGVGSSQNVSSNKYIFRENDILFGKLRPYFRKIIKAKFNGICSTDIWVIRAKQNINQTFLFYFFTNQTLINLSYSSSKGTRMPRADWSFLSQTIWLFPPLTIQQKIAEILSSFDDKIDLLHRQNKTLESLALTLFRHYFIDNPNRSEWEEKPLKYFGNIICGKTPPKNQKEYFNGTYPFIKIPDMHNNVFVFQTADSLTQQGLDSQKAKTLPPFSVCVSCIATIGVVSMNANIAQTNQQINSIVPHKEHYRYFLYCSMKSSFDELEAMASGGTATANLNTTDFSNMKLLLPREKEILRFHTETLPFFDKIYNNTKQIQNLQAMRDVLLKAIFKERE